jgi:dTDP-glucose 4,6-dehydratase
MTILVTGGAGFIGSNFILDWFKETDEAVINLDKLTYAGNYGNFCELESNDNFIFVRGDINDSLIISNLLKKYKPRAIINFAAESHVDRSIHGPKDFIETNIIGTFNLLEESRKYWNKLNNLERKNFRFLHISTDEVYGTLSPEDPQFTELNRYKPNSPYSASKASSDHLVRAWHHTYGLPVLTTNCSNNYGPLHFPEKLIPLVITNALSGLSLPVYGDGMQIRDWLYVSDHTSAIRCVLQKGEIGEVYNVGGWNEKTNIDIVNKICSLLDELRPDIKGPYSRLIEFVRDRPGHDQRYAIDASKIFSDLGWKPSETFESGIKKTVQWYLSNPEWVDEVKNKTFDDWVNKNYKERS